MIQSLKQDKLNDTHSEEHASNRRRTHKTQNLGPQQQKQEGKEKLKQSKTLFATQHRLTTPLHMSPVQCNSVLRNNIVGVLIEGGQRIGVLVEGEQRIGVLIEGGQRIGVLIEGGKRWRAEGCSTPGGMW